jgi:hypothetical protein
MGTRHGGGSGHTLDQVKGLIQDGESGLAERLLAAVEKLIATTSVPNNAKEFPPKGGNQAARASKLEYKRVDEAYVLT